MSYCRFSDMDFSCDVYTYHDIGGFWRTYVASNRPTAEAQAKMPPPLPAGWTTAEYIARHKEVMRVMHDAEHEPVGLPHDGATFTDSTAKEAAVRLEWLRAVGYNVPDYAIEELLAEAEE
jgi:hypothetical protein